MVMYDCRRQDAAEMRQLRRGRLVSCAVVMSGDEVMYHITLQRRQRIDSAESTRNVARRKQVHGISMATVVERSHDAINERPHAMRLVAEVQ